MSDFADLNFHDPVNSANEDLDVEFKLTLNLRDNAGKAKLAKEICALANHGGGWIVLGRNDDGTYPNNLPEDLVGIEQDDINQIASAYLQPSPHCSVQWIMVTELIFKVLVIRVPQAGVAPVCGLKNGPNDEKQRTVGIKKGVYYTRKSGPKSDPIESPDDWQNVIRRCVLQDKTALLGALSTMLDQPTVEADDVDDLLQKDMKHIQTLWLDAANDISDDQELAKNFICYGFQFVDAARSEISEIKNFINLRPADTRKGRQFFDEYFSNPKASAVFENCKVDGLEARAVDVDFDDRFVWRINENWAGSEIFPFWEDTEWIKMAVDSKSSNKWDRGKHIWIGQQIWYSYSFLAMVDHFAKCIGYAGKVSICLSYSGLEGRSLRSADRGAFRSGISVSHQSQKDMSFTIEAKALKAEVRSSVIVAMVQPLNKLMQGRVLDNNSVMALLDA